MPDWLTEQLFSFWLSGTLALYTRCDGRNTARNALLGVEVASQPPDNLRRRRTIPVSGSNVSRHDFLISAWSSHAGRPQPQKSF